MYLKITVINQACKFCHASLPALTAAASPGHPSQGRMLGCIFLTCIQISRKKSVMKGSVNRLQLKKKSYIFRRREHLLSEYLYPSSSLCLLLYIPVEQHSHANSFYCWKLKQLANSYLLIPLMPSCLFALSFIQSLGHVSIYHYYQFSFSLWCTELFPRIKFYLLSNMVFPPTCNSSTCQQPYLLFSISSSETFIIWSKFPFWIPLETSD